jgi:hypothetical protein
MKGAPLLAYIKQTRKSQKFVSIIQLEFSTIGGMYIEG